VSLSYFILWSKSI